MAQGKGIRIQKVLSDNGIMSRRKAEEAIRGGRITVNGRPAVLGNPVNPARDVIAVDGVRVVLQRRKKTMYSCCTSRAAMSPTTSDDEMGSRAWPTLCGTCLRRFIRWGGSTATAKACCCLTNDGNIANMVMHPSNHNSKTYRVTVRPDIT
jgi:23S rRNA pseudouridine2605 synthase